MRRCRLTTGRRWDHQCWLRSVVRTSTRHSLAAMRRLMDGRPLWPAYAAATWSALFAAFSFYYAAGGTAGLDLQPLGIQDQAGTHAFTVVLWVTGAMKVLAGGLAVALARPASCRLRRQAALVAGLGMGVLCVLYGGAQLVQAVLWEVGAYDVPANIGARAARWKLLFDSVWLLGGALFVLAACSAQNSANDSGPVPRHLPPAPADSALNRGRAVP